jgi:hypothetical protein
MSGAPISAPEGHEPAAARAGGWTAADLDWERTSEEALRLMASGCPEQSCRLWREALEIARAAFAATDLRLGTSLANVAACERRNGTAHTAAVLLAEAREIWDGAEGQVETLEMERRARSSLFHLRLELRHRAAYDANARRRLRGFAEDARARLRALEEDRPAPRYDLERWRAERPARYGEVRKFLAACLLLAGPPAGERA